MVTKLLCASCSREIDTSKPYYTVERGRRICPKCAGKTEGSEDTTQGDKTPQTLTSVAILPNSAGVMLPGEVNELHTRHLVRETHRNFLQIGKLLKDNRDNAWWSTAGRWESFSNYIESLGISKSAGYSMIAVAEVQSVGTLSEADILEIGIAKMGLLVSAKKVDDVVTVALARDCPVRELKKHLGHKVLTNDPNHSIICPHCGVAIEGAQWVRLKT